MTVSLISASNPPAIKAAFCFGLNHAKLECLREAGFNTVVIQNKYLKPTLLTSCKALGLRVYVDLGLFVGVQKWKDYPDARPVSNTGKTLGRINWYNGVCPNHPQVRQENLSKINELLKLDISGLFLDFIRYPCHWEKVRSSDITEYCYCPNCLEAFKQAGGHEPRGEAWTAWKCQQITGFVKDVAQLKKQLNPQLKLGLFTVPWRADDFDSAIRRIIGQDRLELAPYVDLFAPMTYHKLTGNRIEWIDQVAAAIKRQTRKPVIAVIQAMDEPSPFSINAFEEMLTMILHCYDDLMVFHADALLENLEKLKCIRHHFKRI